MARTREQMDAIPSLTTLPERVSVLEVRVQNINEKIDDIKGDMCTNHETVLTKLKEMQEASTLQHNELGGKIKNLENLKNRGMMWALGIMAFLAGAGWLHAADLPKILKFIGL
jgi:hypothetical protein